MKKQNIKIENIPAIVWGEKSDKIYIYVHGKCQCKEYAESFAEIAENKGYQTISFDLPKHGERADEATPCDIWSGMDELEKIKKYVFEKYEDVSLFACSLGAFFALNTYYDIKFSNCLFHSPIVDMKYLIKQMFIWFSVNEDELFEKGEIETPFETLSWKYYSYVKENPILKWSTPTKILFGSKDNMQNESIMQSFIAKFGGILMVSENSEHSFMGEGDGEIVSEWLERNI